MSNPSPPESAEATTRYRLMTAMAPGAIAVVQLHGPELGDILSGLTSAAVPARWGLMELNLLPGSGADKGGGGDEAVIAWISGTRQMVQIMPHGGVRVVQRLLDQLQALGVQPMDAADARSLYPEAATALEADMLETLSRAASPAAVDLLLDQPRLWAEQVTSGGPLDCDAVRQRSAVLDRLVEPPLVVVVGPANVGKSTLTNRLAGSAASLTADLPGTTRDWVTTLVILEDHGEGGRMGGAVRWVDTPGVRETTDRIEQQAIAMARTVIANADVVISLREPGGEWVDEAALGRAVDLRVLNKADCLPTDAVERRDVDVAISAATGEGLAELAGAVLRCLGLAEVREEWGERWGGWAFSERLREIVTQAQTDEAAARQALAEYVGL
ncbi:MAG: GTPase [Phycisphaeraceae bacterium]